MLARRLCGLGLFLTLPLLSIAPLHAQVSPQAINGLSITPDGGTLTVPPNTNGLELEFFAHNGLITAGTWTFTCTKTGNVTCGSVVPASATIASGGNRAIAVFYSTTTGGTGRITVNATGGETGFVNIDIATVGAPAVALRNHNRDNVDRSMCLTAGAGESAAWSCGDLVLTHAMPGYTTMNRERSLTLIHNSATAWPRPVVAAVVNQSGRTLMDSVHAELLVGTTLVDSANYGAWSTGPQSARQIALDFNGGPMATGAYPMEFRVTNRYASGPFMTSVFDTLLIVNRFFGEYGAGFGISGVEQLYFNQPVNTGLQHILWVGGDGSAKLYRKVPASSTWIAPLGAFQDTITLSGTTYTRRARHGIQVQFDNFGRHIATINRIGQTTTFTYTGTPPSSRLTAINIPPTGAYTLAWDGTAENNLDYILDPAGRKLNVDIVSGRVNSFTDPGGGRTVFGWDADRRIVRRVNRAGWATTYEYSKGLATGSLVTKVDFPIGRTSDVDRAATVFEPWNGIDKGLATGFWGQLAVDTALAVTWIRGPRTIPDDAEFWVDRWGAPVKMINAVAATTTFVRGDALHPALVTRVTYPNGRIVDQSYNARGNLTKIRDDITPIVGDPPTRVTEYKYTTNATAKFVDSPLEVWDSVRNGAPGAAARKTRYHYTPADGLTDSIYDPRGHRTSYTYKTSGTLKGSLIRVTEHNVETWDETAGAANDLAFQYLDQERRFDYDTKGNLKADTSAVGGATSYVRDLMGRVTNVYDPLKTRTERIYDELNRVKSTRQYMGVAIHPIPNPLGSCDATQVTCADNNVNWDVLPNLSTTYNYDSLNLRSVQDHRLVPRSFTYDTRGLGITETDDYGYVKSASYDEAGLVTKAVSRTQREVRYYYDAGGRRKAMAYDSMPLQGPVPGKVVPGDSVIYTYDVMDNLVTVTNREGTITREYMRNGLLKKKTMDFTGSTLPNDVAVYGYDETGAIATITRGAEMVVYSYAASSGLLSSMDVHLGAPFNATRTFTFDWDSLGRRQRITYPTNAAKAMTVEFRYDKAGLMRRLVSKQLSPPSNDIFNFTYRNVKVDPIGRILGDSLTCAVTTAYGSPCEGAVRLMLRNTYSRNNSLLRQENWRGSTKYVDSMSYDASGNMMYRKQAFSGETHTFTLDPGAHNRLARFLRSELGPSSLVITTNNDGSRSQEIRDLWVDALAEQRFYYYDGLGRMTGTAEYIRVPGTTPQLSDRPSACQYDGDGRMIRTCDNGTPFTLLDGDNTSGTESGTGADWRFFHGPGLDDPLLGYFRGTVNRLYLYVTDGNGREFAVADTLGQRSSQEDQVSPLSKWYFAGATKRSNTFDSDRLGSAQAPGLSFFRNRAYDQASGRWTQEDPIGVAGGTNLYQFNGNNPVAYTDPFGLCPIAKDGVPCTLTKAGAGVVGGALTGVLVGAIGGTFAVPGVGTIAGAGSGGVFGGTVGLVAGGLVGAAQDATEVSGALVKFSERGAGKLREWITALALALGGHSKQTRQIEQPPAAEAEDRPRNKDDNEKDSGE